MCRRDTKTAGTLSAGCLEVAFFQLAPVESQNVYISFQHSNLIHLKHHKCKVLHRQCCDTNWSVAMQIGVLRCKLECCDTNWSVAIQIGVLRYKLECCDTNWNIKSWCTAKGRSVLYHQRSFVIAREDVSF